MTVATLDGLTEATAKHLGLEAGDPQRAQLPGPVAAAAGSVEEWHGLKLDTEWPANRYQGTVMLAARLHRRRNSADAVTNDNGYGPMYVARHDPDISMLLGLDRYMKPKAV